MHKKKKKTSAGTTDPATGRRDSRGRIWHHKDQTVTWIFSKCSRSWSMLFLRFCSTLGNDRDDMTPGGYVASVAPGCSCYCCSCCCCCNTTNSLTRNNSASRFVARRARNINVVVVGWSLDVASETPTYWTEDDDDDDDCETRAAATLRNAIMAWNETVGRQTTTCNTYVSGNGRKVNKYKSRAHTHTRTAGPWRTRFTRCCSAFHSWRNRWTQHGPRLADSTTTTTTTTIVTTISDCRHDSGRRRRRRGQFIDRYCRRMQRIKRVP